MFSDKKIKAVRIVTTESTTAAKFYLDVRNNKRQVKYLHPDLEPILKSTNGVIVYQEQLMKIIVDFGGHTLEESDVIRGAIAKKKHNVMMAAFDKIRAGTMSRGWTQEQADTLCQQIMAFAKYSFNLSHSHAYSELGYITMYLKHHHPLEWWCSVLNLHIGSETKMRADMMLLGDLVQPPSLKNPTERFSIIDDKIYAPISAIKGIGPKAVEEISRHNSFNSLEDFVEKVTAQKVNAGHFWVLVKSRACDLWINDIALLLNGKVSPGTEYAEARISLCEQYAKLRKLKVPVKEEMRTLANQLIQCTYIHQIIQ